MTEVIFRIAGQVLDFLKEEAIYARPYGDAITQTWTANKYEIISYDRQRAMFRIKTNVPSPPRLRELFLFYTPLNNKLDTANEPTKIELQYYSKHIGDTNNPIGNEEQKADLDKLVNGMYFGNWNYTSVVNRFKRAGFKTYNAGMHYADMDLDTLVRTGPKDTEGTYCNIKVKIEQVGNLVVTDMRIV